MIIKNTMNFKILALKNFIINRDLEIIDTITCQDEDDTSLFNYGNEEYLVLFHEEAEALAYEEAKEQLWAFNPQALVEWMENSDSFTQGQWDSMKKAFHVLQNELCEDAQSPIASILGPVNAEGCVRRALENDGLAHTLAPYDHEEHEIRIEDACVYIYRRN